MLKAKLLKVINPLLLLVLISQAVTGFGHDKIDHEVFEALHFTGGLLLVVLGITHLILNWSWVKTAYRKHAHPKE